MFYSCQVKKPLGWTPEDWKQDWKMHPGGKQWLENHGRKEGPAWTDSHLESFYFGSWSSDARLLDLSEESWWWHLQWLYLRRGSLMTDKSQGSESGIGSLATAISTVVPGDQWELCCLLCFFVFFFFKKSRFLIRQYYRWLLRHFPQGEVRL